LRRGRVIGVFGPESSGKTALALRFYSSMRIEVRRTGSVDEATDPGKQAIGNRTRIRVVKNKLAPPFREAETDIIYGKGIVRERELLHLGESYGIIERRGAWYVYGDERLGQGQANAAQFLEGHSDIAEEIEDRVREASIPESRKDGTHGAAEAVDAALGDDDVVDGTEKVTADAG